MGEDKVRRVLVCVDSFETGGVTEVVKNIYRNINRHKFKIDFISMRRLGTDFENEIIARGDEIIYVSLPKLCKIPVLNYNIRILGVLNQIRQYFCRNSYDVVHIHAHADIYTVVAKYLGIKNIIIHAHEAVTEFNGNEKISRITRYILNKRRKLYTRNATYLAGDSLKACIAKYGSGIERDERMIVLHPPVDEKRFNPSLYSTVNAVEQFLIDRNKLNLLHIGRLSPVKNQKFIIDIVKEIKKSRSVHCYMVGDGDMKENLKSYAREIGVEQEVSFLPGDTSPLIYKGMDCSVLPSFSEAFGMVAVESQMMGIPCFASKNVPVDVDIGRCKFIALEEGAAFWAEAIISYLNNTEWCGQTVGNKFSLEGLVCSIEKIYSKV